MTKLKTGLWAALPALLLATSAFAQSGTETTLQDFDADMMSCFGCSAPPMEAADHTLYGATPSGGAYGGGILYRHDAASGFAVLHDFTGKAVQPMGAPVQLASGDLLGISGAFRKHPGSLWLYTLAGGFRVLTQFTGPNGASPNSLTKTPDGRVFGTTYKGGTHDKGALFQVDATNQVGVVYSFSRAAGAVGPSTAPVLANDGALYGFANTGGTNNAAVTWRYGADGSFSILHIFDQATEGSYPTAGLIQGRDGALYGTMSTGPGSSGYGLVFRLTLDGQFSTVHVFNGLDGLAPQGSLTQDAAGNLLGATQGSTIPATGGTLFRIAPDGSFSTLYAFQPAHDGQFPNGLTLASDGKAYGLASYGGANGDGTFWQVTLP